VAASSRLDPSDPRTDAPNDGVPPRDVDHAGPTGPLDLGEIQRSAGARSADERPRRGLRGGGSTPQRLAAGGLVLAVLAGGYAFQQVRASDAEAAAVEQRTAEAQLAADLGEVRDTIATPARDGQNTASALLRHQLLLIAGEGPDTDVGDRLVTDLRESADELADAATTPLPERPTILPVATVDPIYARLSGLEAQAADLAETYRVAADDTEQALAAVRELETAAVAYADTSSLPSTDDPDAVADVWRAEAERLDGYQDAIDAAADVPAAAPLAAAHQQLVDGMRELTDDALARLGADDIAGYNALLSDRLGQDDPFGFSAALDEARSQVADEAIDGPLDDARERGLGLLTELDELRRTTPAQLAEIP
jgi:hypothetical protein